MAKEKIYKLAQEFRVSSEALVQMLRTMGIVVKSHMSTVDENLRGEIKKRFDSERAEIKKEYELIEQIVRIRKLKKISQVELAKKACVSQQAVSRLEREKHIPKIDTLMKIVDGLGLKLTLTER